MSSATKIVGYSTALFSTWYFVEQYNALFDCGDGVVAHLMQKSRKVKHCFVSHADRDHLTGLLQFQQLNGRSDLNIYYPKDCGSFPALAEFTRRFDHLITGTRWHGIQSDQSVSLRADLKVRAIANGHVTKHSDQIKSLSFVVERTRRKLKPEYQSMDPQQIASIRKEKGEDAITDAVRNTELIYSGDTPIERDGRYQGTKTLIHEATFLTRDELTPNHPYRNKHSSLDDVMQIVADSSIQNLVLGHFSSRYSDEQILDAVEQHKQNLGIDIPIHCVLPGRVFTIEV